MAKNDQEQIRRIAYYEGILRDAERLLGTGDAYSDPDGALRGKVRELDEYYGSDIWKKDFSDDEAGLLPKDLPRGVLSEDGIYNVLAEYREQVLCGITEELYRLQDKKYAVFQASLIPNIDPESFIGVRTPELRALAKRLRKEADISVFLKALPHRYFDENQLHAFILSEERSFDICVEQLERFLPHIDNWATCDQLSPKIFRKHAEELLPYIRKWIRSGETYTVRFAAGMLMQHYLDERFSPEYPAMAAEIRSEEYYVNMMRAWYFATALAKQYDAVIPYIKEHKLDTWTHNKTIQKCVESRRISPERKEYLKTLRIS